MAVAPVKTRVVVVDDSALVRSMLAQIIDRQPDMCCVGAAADPLLAREMIRSLNPDVITLDIEMPRMDGLEFLARLMRLRPMPVVMVSTLTERGADVTLRALELGAVDFVAKPRVGVADGLQRLGSDIADKIRTAALARVQRRLLPTDTAPVDAQLQTLVRSGGSGSSGSSGLPVGRPAADRIIFIGASTGGTEATRELLLQLPADSPPLLIVQHMPAGFTQRYAARLDGLCRIRVSEAVHGEPVLPGRAYIAPGGLHLSVARSGAGHVLCVQDGPPVNRHKPSVDVLFDSAARCVGHQALGVLLTGMGNDGARGLRAMRDAGSFNVVQDENSCVVFGMPREAIAHGAAHEVLPLRRIAPRLLERLRADAALAVARG